MIRRVALLLCLFMPPSVRAELTYTTHWLGNTFGGGDSWVQNYAEGLAVAADGTVRTHPGIAVPGDKQGSLDGFFIARFRRP